MNIIHPKRFSKLNFIRRKFKRQGYIRTKTDTELYETNLPEGV